MAAWGLHSWWLLPLVPHRAGLPKGSLVTALGDQWPPDAHPYASPLHFPCPLSTATNCGVVTAGLAETFQHVGLSGSLRGCSEHRLLGDPSLHRPVSLPEVMSTAGRAQLGLGCYFFMFGADLCGLGCGRMGAQGGSHDK